MTIMNSMWWVRSAGFYMAVGLWLAPGIAVAQVPDAKPPKLTAKTAPPQAAGATAPAGDNGLKARVESLEEQLVDLQVVIGTLESLAKSGGGSAAHVSGVPGGADGVRVEALESQVRNLQGQVQQLSDQVRSMGGTPRRSDLGSPSGVPLGIAAAKPGPSIGQSDDIGGLIDGKATTAGGADLPPIPMDTPPSNAAAANGVISGAPGAPPVTTAALPPAGGSDPKQLYETAYGYLLQRDYGAAEVAFDEFLKRFPADSLSGNAQYWLGESYFVRGQYKSAAGAFLKGYQTYAQSQKAPDSLLKLAMSLDKLGQKDAACSSFAELNAKFPNAPQNVKSRAQSERQRIACP